MKKPTTPQRKRTRKHRNTQDSLPLLSTLDRLFPLISKHGLSSTTLALKMGLANSNIMDRLIYLAQTHFPNKLKKCIKIFMRRKLIKEKKAEKPVKVQKEIKSLEFYLSL